MYILGLNAYHGDAAAAIIRDGELIAAVELLRTLLADKRDRLRGESQLDYLAKKNAVLAVKECYPDISDDQLHDVMRRAVDE